MSTREITVPKSLDAHRTNAKTVLGANDRMRRWRSMICSATGRPNRIRFSIRFSSHKSSTVVRSVTSSSEVCRERLRKGRLGRALARSCLARIAILPWHTRCDRLLAATLVKHVGAATDKGEDSVGGCRHQTGCLQTGIAGLHDLRGGPDQN